MSKNTNLSENEDDPEVYESSGDEWKNDEESKPGRRASQRLSKKPRITVVDPESSSDDDDDDSDDEPRKRKSKNGMNKKPQKVSDKEDSSSDTRSSKNSYSAKTTSPTSEPKSTTGATAVAVPVSRGIHRKFIPKTIFSEDYATGSFVILKKDAQVGDPSKHPCIWRIDGKALLQKYEAFDEDGKVRHKNTSIYTGWSPMDKDLYAPITVDVIHHNNQNLTVELHWDKLKEINIDSD